MRTTISHVLVEWASPGDVIAEMEGFSGLIYGKKAINAIFKIVSCT